MNEEMNVESGSKPIEYDRPKATAGITGRAVILIIVLAVVSTLFQIGRPDIGVSWPIGMGSEALPSIPGFLMLLIFGMLAFRAKNLAKALKLDLTQAELMIVYAATGVMSLLGGISFLLSFLPTISRYPYEYLQNPDAYWYIKFVSPLLYPKGDEVILNLYKGDSGVPWSAWIGPLFFWFLIFGSLFFLIYAVASLFYARWSDEEQLVFPVVLPVVSVTRIIDGKPKHEYSFKNWIFVVGIVVPFLLWLPGLLNRYFPVITPITLDWELSKYFSGTSAEVLATWPGTWFRLIPTAMGLAYLAPTDFSFSFWFFYYIFHRVLVLGGLKAVGVAPSQTYLENQFIGGCIGMAIFLVFLSRSSIRSYFMAAVGKAEDNPERMPMPSKLLVFGGLVALLILLIFGSTMLSISWYWMLLHLVVLLSMTIFFMRVRAEAGMPSALGSPFTSTYVIEPWWGSKVISSGSRVGLRLIDQHSAWGMPGTGGWVLESFKLADTGVLSRRSMLASMGLAFVAIFFIGSTICLKVFYSKGLDIGVSPVTGLHIPANAIYPHIVLPRDPDRYTFVFALGGAVLTLLFGFLRASFAWWPFHPLGYALAGNVDSANMLPGSFLVVWIVKVLAARYGGSSLVEKLRPLFVGFIVADVLKALVGFVVTFIEMAFF